MSSFITDRPNLRNTAPVLDPTGQYPEIGNSALTCCSLDISASISTTMSGIFMNPPVSRITPG